MSVATGLATIKQNPAFVFQSANQLLIRSVRFMQVELFVRVKTPVD